MDQFLRIAGGTMLSLPILDEVFNDDGSKLWLMMLLGFPVLFLGQSLDKDEY